MHIRPKELKVVSYLLAAWLLADAAVGHAASRPVNPTWKAGAAALDLTPDGPVDHDVPVLKVTGGDGKPRAILFGYACHNTSTGFYPVISGDYAGYAQQYLEEAYPGSVALFMIGAGGDQNPYPRHSPSMEQPAQHGRTLANAVEAALAVVSPRQVHGPLRSAFAYVDLDFADIARADLERRARVADASEKKRAAALLEKLSSGGKFRTSYPVPVQVVRFGNDLLLTAVGGEITATTPCG